MFGLPKPPIPPISSILSRFPKPAFFVPDIQPDIVDPVVIWRNEVSISGCNIIISPKKYDVFGQLLEVGAPWVIHNPACKPLINYDPELNRIDAPLPIAGNYALWMVNQQISIWENWAGFKKASFEMFITPVRMEYKEFPGNHLDGGNYPITHEELSDGRRVDTIYAPYDDFGFYNYQTNEYEFRQKDSPFYTNDDRHPLGILSTIFGLQYHRVDTYGNFISDEPENKPILRNLEYGYFERYLEEEEIIPTTVIDAPDTQMGVSIECTIKINMKTTLNEYGGKWVFDSDSDFTDETFSDTYETSYVWEIYKRPNHPSTESNYYREKAEAGNCQLLNGSYGIRYRQNGFDQASLFGGGSFTREGWQCYEFYLPGDWLTKNIDMARGEQFTWITGYGYESKEIEVLPPNIRIDFSNQSRAGFTIGHIFITQEPESASPNPYAFTDFPIYTSYRHQEDNGFISEQIYYNLENEPPPMNKDNKCCEKQDARLTAAFKKIRTLETRMAEIEDGDNPATANRLDAIENYINQLDAVGSQINQYMSRNNNLFTRLINIVRGVK